MRIWDSFDVDMTEEDRAALAARLQEEMNAKYDGIAKRAYIAAGVNAATWARATGGLTIKPHKQREIVGNLWPETKGDWTKIPEPVGGSEQDAGYVASPGERVEAGATDDEVLREIRAMREDVRDLSKRVARIEQQGP